MKHAKLVAASVAAATLALTGHVGAADRAESPARGQLIVVTDTTLEVTDAMIDAGRQVYQGAGLCKSCHGANLEGRIVAPNLKDDKWKYGDGSYPDILGIVQKGVSGTSMQPHPGGISDEQARNVAAYVWAVSQGKVKP